MTDYTNLSLLQFVGNRNQMAEDEFLDIIRKYKMASKTCRVWEWEREGEGGVINTCVISKHKESSNYGAHTHRVINKCSINMWHGRDAIVRGRFWIISHNKSIVGGTAICLARLASGIFSGHIKSKLKANFSCYLPRNCGATTTTTTTAKRSEAKKKQPNEKKPWAKNKSLAFDVRH